MLELDPNTALDMTNSELDAYSKGYKQRRKDDLDVQVEIAALQACWIINYLMQLADDPLTPDKLLGRDKHTNNVTTREDYENIVRQIEGGE